VRQGCGRHRQIEKLNVTAGLATKLQRLQEAIVTLLVRALRVIEQLPALSHQHQETTTGRNVLLVDGQMIGQMVDALRRRAICTLELPVSVSWTLKSERLMLNSLIYLPK